MPVPVVRAGRQLRARRHDGCPGRGEVAGDPDVPLEPRRARAGPPREVRHAGDDGGRAQVDDEVRPVAQDDGVRDLQPVRAGLRDDGLDGGPAHPPATRRMTSAARSVPGAACSRRDYLGQARRDRVVREQRVDRGG